MHEKVKNLIYTVRNLCEVLHDRNDVIDEELKDFIEETESCLEELMPEDENEDLLD